jgi:hypothetical protein
MKLSSKIISLVFTTVTLLQGCAAPTDLSESYRRLNAKTLDTVSIGKTSSEVIQILGKPWTVITYALKPHETYLNWYWYDDVNDAMIFAAVMDTNNRVIRTERWLDPDNPKNLSADTRP